ncbi:MAG: CHAT domain-containing protein [Cyanobacteria bacterium J06607_17]
MMAKARQYIDFYLQLRDLDLDTSTCKIAVLPSVEVGETRNAITVHYDPHVLRPYLKALEQRSISQENLIWLGKHLANLLLPPGEIRTLFEKTVEQVDKNGGVRLRLITHEPELAQLPWEYSYLELYPGAHDYRHFLVLNPQISLVRHEPINTHHPKLEGHNADELTLLVAMANPQGDLDLPREQKALSRALDGFQVDGIGLDWQPILENATRESLTTALRRKPEIFYFSGHGKFEQEGYIQLHGTDPAALMSAVELVLELKQANVQVAIFGTCESAKRDGLSEWAGIAPTLVAGGVPIVIAMQSAVLDHHATAFSEAFYISLAAGLSVEEAMTSGRLAMFSTDISHSRDMSMAWEAKPKDSTTQPAANMQWGVPVLYMRAAESTLFTRKVVRPFGVSQQIRKVITQTINRIQNGSEVTGVVIKNNKSEIVVEMNVGTIDGSKVAGVVIE